MKIQAVLSASLLTASFGVCAQSPPVGASNTPQQLQNQEQAERSGGRAPQRVQRIRVEDESNRIEELRYGGDTQRITVQPKGAAPEYEIPPASAARGTAGQREGVSPAPAQRVWNLFRF